MNKSKLTKQLAVAFWLLFAFAVATPTKAQNDPTAPAQIQRVTRHVARPMQDARPKDDLDSVTLTDDQKARIDKIRQDMMDRMDLVIKDRSLNEDRKRTMIDGLRRMESNQIFQVLTPEQRSEVRTKILERRAAAQQESNGQPAPPPK